MENVVTAIFEVEAEAYKAFSEIRQRPFGEGYTVAEASLLKRTGDTIAVAEVFDAMGVTSDDTAAGLVVGSIVGILGGPLGVLLGAGTGALVGSTLDSADTLDSALMLEVMAAKLYDGDVAIVALVQEDEPAFDAAFAGYETTIVRHFAVDVMDEVDLARKATADLSNQVKQQLRAERKAEKEADKAERKAEKAANRAARKQKIQDRFDEVKAKREDRKAERAERKAELAEGAEIANAQFTSATQEMLGNE